MKERVKWIVLAAVLILIIVLAVGCRDKGTMKAVSEDGAWTAYAFEVKEDGDTVWKGALVYTGDNEDKIKNVRTQRGVNGKMYKFGKRSLQEAGTDGIDKGDIGGAPQYYLFSKGIAEKPNSLSVKVKWKEEGKQKVEKLWLLDQ